MSDVPYGLKTRWPPAELEDIVREPARLAGFSIDHDVATVKTRGGAIAAERTLKTFLGEKLDNYSEHRNHPDEDVSSGLSPYLHFGHISVHQVFHELMRRDEWSIDDLSEKPNGSREGWWGASPAVEAFLDELITCASWASTCAGSEPTTINSIRSPIGQ